MKFIANFDRKVTIWQNTSIAFEANNEAHARQLLEKWQGEPIDIDVEYLQTEFNFDTEKPMTVAENGNQPVFELQSLELASDVSTI